VTFFWIALLFDPLFASKEFKKFSKDCAKTLPESKHYCLVSLMWMKIGSNDITAQVPGVSKKLFSLVGTPKITRGSATRDFFLCPTRENNFFRLSSYCTVIPQSFSVNQHLYLL
jgi:hypothetical protein